MQINQNTELNQHLYVHLSILKTSLVIYGLQKIASAKEILLRISPRLKRNIRRLKVMYRTLFEYVDTIGCIHER